MRNKTLMKRAGEQGDAMPINLIAKVLTSDANTGGAGWFEDIDIQIAPFLNRARR